MFKSVKSAALASGLALAATVPAQAQGFEGAYAGVYAGMSLNGATVFLGGAQAGYNFAFGGGAIAGVEGDVMVASGTAFGSASARLGYAIGSNAMLFGSLGLGINDLGATFYQFGGGGEVNVTDNVYVRAEVDRLAPFGPGGPLWVGKLGVGYRF